MNDYLGDLGEQLRRRGVPARLRRRIVVETADHLQSDPQALARFGDAGLIAQRFADVMGSRAATRSALETFGGLAVSGLFVGALVLAWAANGSLRAVAAELSTPRGAVLAAAVAIAPQVSVAAGVLALLRVLRRRRAAMLPAAEVRIIRRRTAVALVAGIATLAALAVSAVVFARYLPAWSTGVAVSGAIGGSSLLLATAVPAMRAWRYRVAVDGGAGDVFVDIGSRFAGPLDHSPWAFAALVSTALGIAVFAAGVVAADGIDGALRGLAEACACLTGFALLGRFLGLRSSPGA